MTATVALLIKKFKGCNEDHGYNKDCVTVCDYHKECSRGYAMDQSYNKDITRFCNYHKKHSKGYHKGFVLMHKPGVATRTRYATRIVLRFVITTTVALLIKEFEGCNEDQEHNKDYIMFCDYHKERSRGYGMDQSYNKDLTQVYDYHKKHSKGYHKGSVLTKHTRLLPKFVLTPRNVVRDAVWLPYERVRSCNKDQANNKGCNKVF